MRDSRAERMREERTALMAQLMQQDDENVRRQRERVAMSTIKVGNRRISRFPSTTGRDDRIAAVRAKLAELFDATRAEQKRAEGMAPQIDGTRFPQAGAR